MKKDPQKLRTYFNPFIDSLVILIWLSTLIYALKANGYFEHKINPGSSSLMRISFEHAFVLFLYLQLVIMTFLYTSGKVHIMTSIHFRLRIWQLHWIKISLMVLFGSYIISSNFDLGGKTDEGIKLPQIFVPAIIFLISFSGWYYLHKAVNRIPPPDKEIKECQVLNLLYSF